MSRKYIFLVCLMIVIVTILLIYYIPKRTTAREIEKATAVVEKESDEIEYPIIDKGDHVPRRIMQTYKNIDKVPNFVIKNIKKDNPDWEYIFMDDTQAVSFLEKEFPIEVSQKFNSFSCGAHKADLFRLCWLYINGGVYVDIDTHLLEPLEKIVKNGQLIIPITEVDKKDRRLLNCFMASTKGDPLILDCIKSIMKVEDKDLKKYYCLILRVMQQAIQGKYEYQFFERKMMSEDWSIYDKDGNKIAESRYKNYDQKKGFANV